jgi:ATP-dependent protease ClpP protease subunit
MKKLLSWMMLGVLMLTSCATTGGGGGTEEAPPELRAIHLKLDGAVDVEHVVPLVLAIGIINEIAEKKPDVIVLEINSGGGDVDIGFELSKAIEGSAIPVLCAVDGEAASMAFFILQSCQIRVATPRSRLMIHEVTIVGPINTRTLPGILEILEMYNNLMIEHISSRMTMDKEAIRKKVSEGDWWMTPTEAIQFGALDGIIEKV